MLLIVIRSYCFTHTLKTLFDMQHRFIALFVSVFFTICSRIQALDVVDCGSSVSFDNIKLERCEQNDEVCFLYIGSVMKISFTIKTGSNTDVDLINDVGLYVRGGPKFDLLVSPANPCDVLLCPLNANSSTTYSAYLYVDEMWPPLSGVDLKWIIKTTKISQVLCLQFPVVIRY